MADKFTDIKIGDYVHYQPKPQGNFLPMGVRNLKVLDISKGISSHVAGLEIMMARCEWEPFKQHLIVPLDDCVKD